MEQGKETHCSVCDFPISECLCVCTGSCQTISGHCDVKPITMNVVDAFYSLNTLKEYQRERLINQARRTV